jgi:HK97 family phage portal protein
LGSITSTTGMLVSQSTAMGVGTVYACVRRRAQDAARCLPSLYSVEADGSRSIIETHPVLDLFSRPNRVQTWFEFAEQMNVALLLRQNAYAAILRDRRGNPIELIPINPDAVMVLEAADGEIFYNVNRIGLWQLAVLRGFDVAIPAEDMLHLRGITFNSLVGVSTIGLGRDAIGLAIGQEQQAARWMANGARPSGILHSAKQLSDDAAKRLRDRWNEYKSGVQNVGQTAVLEDGVEWKPMQMTSVDLEFWKGREFQTEDICRFFGVPPYKVFVTGGASTRSIPQQDQDYVNSTIAPDLERWEYKIERTFDLDLKKIKVHFDEGQLLRADILTRRNAARIGILSGLTTPNEERRAEALPPMPGADRLLVPSNTAALGSDMTGVAPDGAGAPADGVLPDPGAGTSGDQPGTEDLEAQRAAAVVHRLAIPDATVEPPRALPLDLTLNVDARPAPLRRRTGTLRKNDDGTLALELVEAAD